MTEIPTAPGYYWCSHDMAMWIPEDQQFPRDWHVVHIADGYVSHAGADVQTKVGEVPAYVSFIGPLNGPGGHWQSIQTAPKDGTRIDVWTDSGRDTSVEWRVPDKCHSGDPKKPATWCVVEAHYDDFHWHEVDPPPTHWMPLPAPPPAVR